VCDLELQPGERVRDLHVGDAVRWKITPAQSGPEGAETTHIVIKPMDVGLVTTMVITTDRRVYYVKLASSKRRAREGRSPRRGARGSHARPS
jgi:type IV secretion system protein VirB9